MGLKNLNSNTVGSSLEVRQVVNQRGGTIWKQMRWISVGQIQTAVKAR